VTQNLILAGELILYAERGSYGKMNLVVRSTDSSRSVPVIGDIVRLTLDQSALYTHPAANPRLSDLRIACFYSDGTFSIFSVPLNPQAKVSETNRRSVRCSNVLQAAYKHPLLVTMNNDLELSLWRIPGQTGSVPVLCQTFKAFAAFPPFTMSLIPTGNDFKLMVTFCSPVYPSHWLPSAVEFGIASLAETFHLKESRGSSRAIASHTWLSGEAKREMEREWGQKVAFVEILETDGKFLVVGGQDHQLRVRHCVAFL
jgi:hypothetical protein